MSIPNPDLQASCELGQKIASIMPTVLAEAPDSACCRIGQGIILETGTVDHRPRSLWTRYGRWEFVSTSKTTQKKAFTVLVETLGLKKIPLLSNAETSYWSFPDFPRPIVSTSGAGISYKEAQEAIKEFLPGSK